MKMSCGRSHGFAYRVHIDILQIIIMCGIRKINIILLDNGK